MTFALVRRLAKSSLPTSEAWAWREASVRLPDSQDPNSALTESGPEALCALLKKKEYPSPPAPEAAQNSSEKGLERKLGEVHYTAQMMPPLRSNVSPPTFQTDAWAYSKWARSFTTTKS